MNNCLVSVIIPNYKHAKFLNERIQSVLNQTYQNFELIILDDCSPDDGASRNIIERYRNNPHVSQIVYNEVNSGSTFKQWHKGFELAKGDLVWIAESDDSCDKHLLAKLIKGFEQTDTVFSFCKSYAYDAYGNKTKFKFQSSLKTSFYLPGKEFIAKYLSKYNLVANASSVIFKKEAAISIDKQYLNMKAEGDWLLWIEMAELGNVYFVNEELNYFRLHDTNTTAKLWGKGVSADEHLIVFNYLMDVLNVSLIRKTILRSQFVAIIQENKCFENEDVRRMLLKRWDPYFFYRIFHQFHVILYRVKHLLIRKR